MRWHGKDCVEFLEKILVGDISSLEPGNGILSVLTNTDGGIVDDTIITNVGEEFVMTIHDRYEEHFKKQMDLFKGEIFMEYFQHSILAVQGPGSPTITSKLLPLDFDLERMAFMSSRDVLLSGGDACRIARCGFTGEDGFELHISSAEAAYSIASKLLEDPNVKPASLQALDTLRLEAGLCSKGKELSETVNPVEASLGWTIARRRRQEGGFLGADSLLTSTGKLQKAMRICVGIVCLTQVPEVHAEIFDANGSVRIGEVTSAAFSPSIKMPIAMAYVGKAFSKPGTDILLSSTLKGSNERTMLSAQVVKTPFVETRFYKIPKTVVRDPATGEEFESPRNGVKIIHDSTHHPCKAAPFVKEYDSFTSMDEVSDCSSCLGDEFESPRSVTTIFQGTGHIPKNLPHTQSDSDQLKKIRDPSTGEVFECTRCHSLST